MLKVGARIEYHPENGTAPWLVICPATAAGDGELVFGCAELATAGKKLTDPFFIKLCERRMERS